MAGPRVGEPTSCRFRVAKRFSPAPRVSPVIEWRLLADNEPMPVTKIRKASPADGPRVMEIWRRAVDATHEFLTPEGRRAIGAEVAARRQDAPPGLAVNEADRAMGFMLLDGSHMEALFVDPESRDSGIGRMLVEEALRRHPNLSTDVNEENHRAVGFYERLGFERVGRSALDGKGRAYPLIHLRYAG